MFSQCKQGFDTVLIDEASQAVEVSTLIPLRYGCRRLILVGDPKQLPATVFSEPATQHNYEQSLFHRLQRGGHQVALLTTQYRMLPQISRFPAARFYKGALDDAPQLKRAPPMPWHELRCLAPYVFYDVADGRAEVKVSHSTIPPHMSHLPWFQRVTPAMFSTCHVPILQRVTLAILRTHHPIPLFTSRASTRAGRMRSRRSSPSTSSACSSHATRSASHQVQSA